MRKDKLCLEDRVMEIIHFQCRLCGKVVYSDLQERETDWDGLRWKKFLNVQNVAQDTWLVVAGFIQIERELKLEDSNVKSVD